MRIRIPVITKAHGVSCNIGIAYTAPSYSVSKVLHNCFQIVNFGDIRDIGVLWRHSRFLICYTKENKFPKSMQQQEKRTSKGKQSPREISGVRRFTPQSKSGQTLQRISACFCAPCFPVYIQMAIVLSICAISAFLMTIICRKRVESMLITNASR